MSLESAIVERLSSRLSDVGRQRLPKCHAIAQEMFRAAWLSALGRGVPVCLADLAVQLADTFHVRVELVGARRYHKLDGAIVISNHLGAAKLIKTNRRQIELALPPTVRRTYPMTGRLLNSDSFLALFSPPVFASIFAFAPARLEFIPLSIQYDGSFGVIAEALGFMQLSARQTTTYLSARSDVLARVIRARERGAAPIVVMFPEGGTTGKRVTADPFKLEPFHSGFLRLSRDLDLPIVPVAVTFDARFEFLAQVLLSAEGAASRCASPIEHYREEMQWSIDRVLNAAE